MVLHNDPMATSSPHPQGTGLFTGPGNGQSRAQAAFSQAVLWDTCPPSILVPPWTEQRGLGDALFGSPDCLSRVVTNKLQLCPLGSVPLACTWASITSPSSPSPPPPQAPDPAAPHPPLPSRVSPWRQGREAHGQVDTYPFMCALTCWAVSRVPSALPWGAHMYWSARPSAVAPPPADPT